MILLKGREVVGPVAWQPIGAMANAAAWRAQRPEVDLAKCTGCLICWKYCPEPAIEPWEGKVRVALAACKGCGICAEECPADAIAMLEEAR